MPPRRRQRRATTRRRKPTQRKRRTSKKKKNTNPFRARNVGVVVNTASPLLQFPESWYYVSKWPKNIFQITDNLFEFEYPGGHIVEYKIGKVIGEGSFGRVSVVHPVNNSDVWAAFALKEFFKMDRNAKDELRLTENPLFRNVMVPAKVFDNKVLMQLGVEIRKAKLAREGNATQVANDVATAVFKMQKKMIDKGFIYTDMKAGNVLIMPVPGSPRQARVVFADYGGICDIRSRDCVYTYMIPERGRDWGFGFDTKNQALQAARWWAGLVGLQVSGLDNRYHNYVEPPDRKHGDLHTQTIQNWNDKLSKYAKGLDRNKGLDVVGRYLRPNPMDRLTPMN